MIPTYFFYAALVVAALLFYVLVRALDPGSIIHKMLFPGGVQNPGAKASIAALAPDQVFERTLPLVDPQVLVRARHGYVLVNRNDRYMGQAILTYGECCEVEMSALLKLCAVTGGAVVEVGTNVGTHTVPIAKDLAARGRSMIVFEPQPFIFQNMCANLSVNAIESVRAWPFAVGDENSVVYFNKQDYRALGNFGGVNMREKEEGAQIAVPTVRLDDFIDNEVIGLMKIDVEGFELAVLKGAEKLIDAQRPVLYVENDRKANSKDLIEWLWAHGYELWWHVPPLFSPDNFFGDPTNIYGNVASFNMICIHKTRTLSAGDFMEAEAVSLISDSSDHPMIGSD